VRSFIPDRRNTGGFSLIEVLVALVISGLALTAIAGVLGNGLLGDQASGEAATALTLAEGKIAAAGAVEPLRPGISNGDFAGHYRWQLRITPYEDRPSNGAADFDRPLSVQLYRIELAVAWSAGTRQRRLTLATLRLGPVPP
jgi:prepilin-type N-terminal cleavage/methylation domain-containing protein